MCSTQAICTIVSFIPALMIINLLQQRASEVSLLYSVVQPGNSNLGTRKIPAEIRIPKVGKDQKMTQKSEKK